MNPSVNRSSDSPQTPDVQSSELSSVQPPHPELSTDNSANVSNPDQAAVDTTTEATTEVTTEVTTEATTEATPSETRRQQPIPPPSEPMQYRAIGLVRGQYMPSAEQLTRGTLLTTDGTLIDAVLLGRVMSLVKNHLSLDQPHLWVVYPRTRQMNGNLHVQVVGVWEPEKLHQKPSSALSDSDSEESQPLPEAEEPANDAEPDDASLLKDGYFSIRGEVIYYSREEEQIIVKIKQSPRRESDKIKFFKLKLDGLLGEKVVGHFWDLHVKLDKDNLLIQEANNICPMPLRKRPKRNFNGGNRPDKRRGGGGQYSRPPRRGEQSAATPPPKRREPLPKPIKHGEQRGSGGTSGNAS